MIESFMKGAIVIEGHVQGLSNTRSLGELGIPVYVLDVTHCLAQHSKYCTKYFRCPKFKSEEFIPFLIELAQKENLQGWFLIGSNDHIVENLSLHAQELAPYYTMIVPAKEQLYNIIDKANLMQIASTCGTHIPKTCDINTLEQTKDFTYPLLIKGREGLSFYKATHQKAIQVNNEEELHSKIQEIALLTNDVMIQELIPFDKQNRVVSFTCFAINGEIQTYWMGQKLREHPIKYGTATMSQSVLLLEVLEEAKPLMKALNYTGVCEIEFMRDPRDGYYKLIEINPRTWLWVGLAKACGIDYAKIMYRYVNGIEQTYPTTYEVGVKWRNAVTDLVFGVQAIIKRHITLCEYFSSFKGKIVKAIWSWKDIKPGLIFPFMTLYIAKKRR
jgi:predicted ATP-grasp superfamily ATP-dependent carboligase